MLSTIVHITDKQTRQRVEVGECEYLEYESLQEAVEHLGEAKVLQFVNNAVKFQTMGDARRRLAPPKPKRLSKSEIERRAFERITREELAQVGGDMEAFKQLLATKIAQVRQELAA